MKTASFTVPKGEALVLEDFSPTAIAAAEAAFRLHFPGCFLHAALLNERKRRRGEAVGPETSGICARELTDLHGWFEDTVTALTVSAGEESDAETRALITELKTFFAAASILVRSMYQGMYGNDSPN